MTLTLRLLAVVLTALAAAQPASAHETLKLDAPKPLLAPTPPMGWNSWNRFGPFLSERLVLETADAK